MTTTTPATPPALPATPGPPVEHALDPFTPDRPPAAWGLRVLAALLDSALVAAVAFLATGAAPTLAALPGLGEPGGDGGAGWTAGTLLALGALQAYTGMTPGKRVAGVAVVDDRSGRPIGLPGTVLRWFAHVLDAIVLIGYLRAAFRKDGRTFADSLLGTVAVRTTRPEPHPLVARLRTARDTHAPWLRWPHRVTAVAAFVLCVPAAGMSLLVGAGSQTEGPVVVGSCRLTDESVDVSASATIVAQRAESWESRLGIHRNATTTWRLGARWTVPADWPTQPTGTPTLEARAADDEPATTVPDDGDPLWADGSWPEPAQDAAGGTPTTLRSETLVTHDELAEGWAATVLDGVGECGTALTLPLDPDLAP
ncbi:RDD family protein [Isoptericola sp. NPDC019571]|uniref:RDD family protein n=1 Tax=Isoptericola sp. NPDC019571 TaxID=3364008 RepID=UPI00379E2E5B